MQREWLSIGAGLLPERLLATLAGLFGILAVLIAAVGLNGVISYLIVRRTIEIRSTPSHPVSSTIKPGPLA